MNVKEKNEGAKPVLLQHKFIRVLMAAMAFVLSLVGGSPVRAYFDDMGGGVRPTGMGEAFVAVADDINAMQYNAAGLSRLEEVEIAGMYSTLYSNLNLRLYNQAHDYLGYNMLAAATPLPELQGSIGLTWKQFSTEFFQENVLLLGYGRKLFDWGAQPDEGGVIDVGCNLKWLQWQLQSNQFTSDPNYYPYAELQKSAFSGDLGVMLRWHTDWRLGLSAENIVPANVGLTTSDYVPPVYRLGSAYEWFLGSAFVDSILGTVEVSERNHEYNPKFGLESRHFHRSVALRAGANVDNFSCGLSYRYGWMTSGLALQLDYAFTYPWHMADTAGSHWVGMTASWDLLNPREAERKRELARKTQSALRAKKIALEAAQAAKQALSEAQAFAKANSSTALAVIKEAAVKVGDTVETAVLAAEVVQAAAAESKDNTLAAVAKEMEVVTAGALETEKQAQDLLREAAALAADQEAGRAATPRVEAPQVSFWPEKYADRIVLGIETKIVTDFTTLQEAEPLLQVLSLSLEKIMGMKLEWRLLSPAELQLALHQNELDGVVTYETVLGKYQGKGRLEPVLTAQTHGQTSQSCCLLVRADSPVTTLSQLKGKRLGYSNGTIVGQLDELFFRNHSFSSGRFFGGLEKQKNARDSLWALQMEAVDALAEYAYILDVANNTPDMKLRVIAESDPRPNAPLWLRSSRYPEKSSALQKLATALLDIQQNPAARSLLRIFKIEKLAGSHAGK